VIVIIIICSIDIFILYFVNFKFLLFKMKSIFYLLLLIYYIHVLNCLFILLWIMEQEDILFSFCFSILDFYVDWFFWIFCIYYRWYI